MAEARAVLVVRNAATHDARVLRCARTLRALGYEPLVLAVTDEREKAGRSMAQGVPIVRLTPRVPLARRARTLLRGRTGEAASGKGSPGPPAPASGRGRPGPVARGYRLLRTLDYYRRGIGALRRLRPRLVHCNDYNTMWIGVAAKLLTGATLVYDSHELWPDRNGRSEPRWWLLACEALFVRLADLNLATSPGHADAIGRRHRIGAPHVVRNIAERPAGLSAAGARDGGGPDGGRTIAYAGALTEGRGLEQAIAALPEAPGVRLRALGPGRADYRARLADLAARRGVAERVALDPPVAPEEVVGEIHGAAAGLTLIQPTCRSYELCLPNKLFEYLAAGLPVLASDLPTIRAFVVPRQIGLLVAPAETAAIAAAMLAIVEPGRNAELRAAVAETAAEHRWEHEAERLRRLYAEAAGAGAGGRA